MSNWKTKQYEIKLKVSQEELNALLEANADLNYMNHLSSENKRNNLIKKLSNAFHKEVIRQEKEKDIKNRVK